MTPKNLLANDSPARLRDPCMALPPAVKRAVEWVPQKRTRSGMDRGQKCTNPVQCAGNDVVSELAARSGASLDDVIERFHFPLNAGRRTPSQAASLQRVKAIRDLRARHETTTT